MSTISFFSQMGKSSSTVDSVAEGSKTSGSEAGNFLTTLQETMQTSNEIPSAGSGAEVPLVYNFASKEQETSAVQEITTDSQDSSSSIQDEVLFSKEAETLIEELITSLKDNEDQKSNEDDEELITDLTEWVQQALFYLYPLNNEETSELGVSHQTITALSENADTVKYAVQEALYQLIEASNTNPEAATNAEMIHTQKQLLVALKEIFNKTELNTDAATKLDSLISELSRGEGSTSNLTESAELSLRSLLLTVSDEGSEPEKVAEQNSTKAANDMIQSSDLEETADHSESAVSGQDAKMEDSDGNQTTNLMTAGQLAMKNGTAVLTKSEMVIPVQQFSKEMSQFVVSKFEIVQQNGLSEAVISLNPQHLGQLDVQLSLQNGHLVARFVTEHAAAKELLEQQMTQLRAALQGQGIQVERLEVTQNTSLSSHMYQNGGNSNGQSDNRRRSKEREQNNEDALKTVEIQDELRSWMQEQQELELYTETDQSRGFTAKI